MTLFNDFFEFADLNVFLEWKFVEQGGLEIIRFNVNREGKLLRGH
jgi:hypothetical protein